MQFIGIAVLLAFFALIFMLIQAPAKEKALSIFLILLFFPAHAYLMKSPSLSPFQLAFYVFFFQIVVAQFVEFKRSFWRFPLTIPIIIMGVLQCATAITNHDGASGIYNAVRSLETYSFLFIGYYLALNFSLKELLERMSIPLIIFCILGVIEALLQDNWPYKIMGSAFPYFDGFYNINGTVSLSHGWRIRTFITTNHPNGLSPILVSLFFLYATLFNKDKIKEAKYATLLGLLGVNIFLCGARTGMFIAFICMIFLTFRKAAPALKIFLVGLLSISMYLGFNSLVKSFDDQSKGSSLSLRETQMLATAAYVSQNPIFGNGLQYTNKYVFERDQYNDRVRNEEIFRLESILFIRAIDSGLAGIFDFFLFYAVLLIYFIRNREYSKFAMSGFLITFIISSMMILNGGAGNCDATCLYITGLCLGNTQKKKIREISTNEDSTITKETNND